MDLSGFTNRIGTLGGLGVIVTAFVGGAVGYVANAPDVAQALATFFASAANAPFSWKGALIAGGAAVAAKVLKNQPPSTPTA